MTPRIEGVVEFFDVDDREEVQCARCGSSIDFADCSDCGGEGWVDSPDDDSWAFMEDELQPCGTCAGSRGWWMCLSSEEFCKTHPLPGREQIRFPAEAPA